MKRRQGAIGTLFKIARGFFVGVRREFGKEALAPSKKPIKPRATPVRRRSMREWSPTKVSYPKYQQPIIGDEQSRGLPTSCLRSLKKGSTYYQVFTYGNRTYIRSNKITKSGSAIYADEKEVLSTNNSSLPIVHYRFRSSGIFTNLSDAKKFYNQEIGLKVKGATLFNLKAQERKSQGE